MSVSGRVYIYIYLTIPNIKIESLSPTRTLLVTFNNSEHTNLFKTYQKQNKRQPKPPTPLKFNSSPLKNGGWKTILSYWGPVTFQLHQPYLSHPIFGWFLPSHLAQVPGWDDVVTTLTSDVFPMCEASKHCGSWIYELRLKKELPFQDLIGMVIYVKFGVCIKTFVEIQCSTGKIQLDIQTESYRSTLEVSCNKQ